jgi:hypothetical protein
LSVVKGASRLLLRCSFSSQNETLLLNSKYVFCQTVIPMCWCYFRRLLFITMLVRRY